MTRWRSAPRLPEATSYPCKRRRRNAIAHVVMSSIISSSLATQDLQVQIWLQLRYINSINKVENNKFVPVYHVKYAVYFAGKARRDPHLLQSVYQAKLGVHVPRIQSRH
jgi:hypothetical protein